VGAATGFHHDGAGGEIAQMLRERRPCKFLRQTSCPRSSCACRWKVCFPRSMAAIATLFMAMISD